MRSVKESDWKKFKNSLVKWRDRYVSKKNNKIRSILDNEGLEEIDKFWDIADFQKKEAKILQNCLDGYSRSKMFLQMVQMKNCGMITRDDLKEFSDDLQKSLKPFG